MKNAATVLLLPFLFVALGLALGCTAGHPDDGEAPTQEEAAPESTPVTAELMAQGAESYTLWCASCHGSEGRGDGPDAGMLDPKPRDQTDPDYMEALSDLEIAETVMYGGAPRGYPNMPAMPQIFGDELIALVAHLRTFTRAQVESVALTADSL